MANYTLTEDGLSVSFFTSRSWFSLFDTSSLDFDGFEML